MKIKEIIMQKDFKKRFILMLVGTFLLAINYHLFLYPNHFVVGGLTGISFIVNQLFQWDATLFIYVGTLILAIIGYFVLGKERAFYSLIGSIFYPIFISLTEGFTPYLIPYISFNNIVLTILFTGILLGFSYGVIYRAGYDTGGSDIMVRILQKYAHLSEGKASLLVQGTIILIGGFTFGMINMIYALFILVLYTTILDKIVIGISDSKQFLITTGEVDRVKNFIMGKLHTGVTILETEGGYSKEKNQTLMCVVPNKDYYLFKETILKIDSNAFLVINDCYEVKGGMKRNNLPFI